MTGKLDVWLDLDAIFCLMLKQYNLVITITALGGLLSSGSRYIPHTTSQGVINVFVEILQSEEVWYANQEGNLTWEESFCEVFTAV